MPRSWLNYLANFALNMILISSLVISERMSWDSESSEMKTMPRSDKDDSINSHSLHQMSPDHSLKGSDYWMQPIFCLCLCVSVSMCLCVYVYVQVKASGTQAESSSSFHQPQLHPLGDFTSFALAMTSVPPTAKSTCVWISPSLSLSLSLDRKSVV